MQSRWVSFISLLILYCVISTSPICFAGHNRAHAIDITIDISQIVITNERNINRTVLYRVDQPLAVVKHSNNRVAKCVFYGYCCLVVGSIGVVVWRYW